MDNASGCESGRKDRDGDGLGMCDTVELNASKPLPTNGTGIKDYWVIPILRTVSHSLGGCSKLWGEKSLLGRNYQNTWNAVYKGSLGANWSRMPFVLFPDRLRATEKLTRRMIYITSH